MRRILTQETFIKALQRQDQLKDGVEGGALAVPDRDEYGARLSAAATGEWLTASWNRDCGCPAILRNRVCCGRNTMSTWPMGCGC